jgi:hypothetical protein
VLAAVTSMTGTTPSPPPIHPVINHDFADPRLLRSRGAYYAYSTMSRYGNALWGPEPQAPGRACGPAADPTGWSPRR